MMFAAINAVLDFKARASLVCNRSANRKGQSRIKFWGFLVLFVLISVSPALALPEERAENLDRRTVRRVDVRLSAVGKLKLNPSGRRVTESPVNVEGDLVYEECVTSDGSSIRSLRVYDRAKATIHVGGSRVEPSLRASRRVISVRVSDDSALLYCPDGPLSAQEIDLLEVPGNSCLLDGLLPDGEKRLGETWKPSHRTLALLFCLDAVTDADISATMHGKRADQSVAKISGTLHGAIGGVATEIQMRGQFEFSRAAQQVSLLELDFSEKRSVGHAEPGFEVDVTLRVSIAPLSEPRALTDSTLADAASIDASGPTDVEFRPASGEFSLLHGRGWHLMIERPDVSVFRLIRQGDLIAQCNVSPLVDLPSGKSVSLEQFQTDVRAALGERFSQFADASQTTTGGGLRVLRVVAVGLVSEIPIQWIYYHVSDENGQRASLVFTMQADVVERFGADDEMFVQSFEFAKTAAREPDSSPADASSDTAP